MADSVSNINDNPVLFNKLYQGTQGYPGEDDVREFELKKGDIVAIVQLANPCGGGDYLIPIEEFLRHDLDVLSLCQSYQVAAFYDESKNKDIATYKPKGGIYVINESINVAKGPTISNTQYGPGGAEQLVMPNGKNKIQEALKDKDFKESHPLIPIDLNNFEKQKEIPIESKEELLQIKELYYNNIDKKEGTINLKNTEINIDIYEVMALKTKLHENLCKQLGALKEYSKELEKNNFNLEYLKEHKNSYVKFENRYSDIKLDLNHAIDKIKSKPELLKNIPEKYKEHLLSPDKYCPEEIKELKKYALEKISYQEKQLSQEEKAFLNIPKEELPNKEFTINENREKSYNEFYENLTREGIIEQLGYRRRVYTPYLEQRPDALFVRLKMKDEFNNLKAKSNNVEIKEVCNKEIEKLDKEISRLTEEIKNNPIPYKTDINEKIEYLKEKVNNKERYIGGLDKLNDSKVESVIDRIYDGVLTLQDNKFMDYNFIKKLSIEITSEKNINSIKSEVLCNLDTMYKLKNVYINSDDKNVKEFCKGKIKELNKSNKTLEQQITSLENKKRGIITGYKPVESHLDNKINYLQRKITRTTTDPRKVFIKDKKIEYEIKITVNETLEKMTPRYSEKIKELNGLYTVSRELNKLKVDIKKIPNKEVLENVKKESQILKDIKEKLEIVDKYKPIIEKYTSKKIFKKSFLNKNISQIEEYNNAKKFLKEKNITSWKDYDKLKTNIDLKHKDILKNNKLSKFEDLKNTAERTKKLLNIQNKIINKHRNRSMDKVKTLKMPVR